MRLFDVFILAPLVWIALYFVLRTLYNGFKVWRNYYRGMPMRMWYGMIFLTWGAKILRSHPKYCKWMRYEGRFWVSPNAEGFKEDA